MSETDTDTDTTGDEAGGTTADDTTGSAGDGMPDPPADAEGLDDEELLAELELLREENRRLRESYVRAKRSQYRDVAVGLAALGLLATLGGVVFQSVRTVLLALGATGLFGGLLTYYLTPERFVAANVGTAVYSTLAANAQSIVSELGLGDNQLYVPLGETGIRVRLFVPQGSGAGMPDEEALESTFVLTDDPDERGLALDPIGSDLFGEFERALDGPLGETPTDLAAQLSEGLVEQFEIADDVAFDADRDRVTAEVDGKVYGDLDRFDHPARSFLAVGLARGLGRPVRVDHADAETVTFRIGGMGGDGDD